MNSRVHQPSVHRMVLLTWIGVYPLLTATALILEPLLSDAPVPLRTLAMSLLVVPTMVCVVMPAIRRLINTPRQSGNNNRRT